MLNSIQSSNGSIKVTITKVSSKSGEVMVALFSSPKGFPYETGFAVQKLKGKAVNGTVELTFPSIPSGTYAIALFHDTNGDGKLNTNFMGIPKEGYGVSNNSYNTFSAPGYTTSSFQHTKAITEISIRVKY
jgi:uncharacterized protein (DUF2141 family)